MVADRPVVSGNGLQSPGYHSRSKAAGRRLPASFSKHDRSCPSVLWALVDFQPGHVTLALIDDSSACRIDSGITLPCPSQHRILSMSKHKT